MSLTKQLKFNVKENSLEAFFTKNSAFKMDKDEFRHHNHGSTVSNYHLMRDEILIKKDGDIKPPFGKVIFELSDYSNGSRKELVNTYTYSVEPYDDVCLKLVLSDFKITTKNK